MIDSFNPVDVWKPFGAFSMGVVQGNGRIVYLKGQVALDKTGAVIGKGEMREQTRKVLDNIKSVLAAVGGAMADIVSLTHYTTDIDAFMKTGDIRRVFFAEPFPVTTTVEVSRLYNRDLLIEITAIAGIPQERFKRPQHA